MVQHEIIASNSLNIFLMIPQYVIMSIGEVLFSVTGLSFAYSQVSLIMSTVWAKPFPTILISLFLR